METKHSWVVIHDGITFGSGWYERGPGKSDAPAYTRAFVQQAMNLYVALGLEETVAYYNTKESPTRCPASSILAGLASTSFAGSPPVPCPAAGLQRRAELPTSREIKGYVADFREFLQEGTFPERKALIRNFVTGIEIVEEEAVLA